MVSVKRAHVTGLIPLHLVLMLDLCAELIGVLLLVDAVRSRDICFGFTSI